MKQDNGDAIYPNTKGTVNPRHLRLLIISILSSRSFPVATGAHPALDMAPPLIRETMDENGAN